MTRTAARTSLACTLALLAPAVAAGAAGPPAESSSLRFFETAVRPVLAEHCLKCHGPDKQKGGLRLDSREALLAGGDSGPAVVPGKPEESLLVEAVRRESIEMPPAGPLGERDVRALSDWVAQGAPWPDSLASAPAASATRPRGVITDEDRDWWAFRPVREPAVPEVDDPRWSAHPIDRFVFQRLRAAGLSPAPEADKVALIRRLTFDLTGLPPTPAEVDAFVADGSADAYERLVDRLLASPRYGERQARLWLDLVRYADSDGYRADHERPNAWLYRDYVIAAFNADTPYDRFLREQVAGDELYPGDLDALVATGYLRQGIYEYNNRDARAQWSVILDDITDTTADAVLGLGLQCAKCHDHKYDPILQKDYYRLRAFFAPIWMRDDLPAASPGEVEAWKAGMASWEDATADLRRELAEFEAPHRKAAAEAAIAKFPEDVQALLRSNFDDLDPLDRQVAELAYRQIDYEYSRLDQLVKGPDKDRLLALRKRLAATEAAKPRPLPIPMAVTDVGPVAPPTVIPKKGGDPVEPGVPSVFDPAPMAIPPLPDNPATTGRRAALANWLTRPDHPLTPRVIVNRLWQQHFGQGLAAVASDFGRLGEVPSHPELLDWLAARLVRDGWSLKSIHRRIVTSAAYRQSSRHPEAEACRVKDPENRLYWRGPTRRLEAEQIRDAVLAASGQLDPTVGGPGVLPGVPRRTIYTKAIRNVRDPFLEAFDLPLAFGSVPSRATTTTPLQSLLLLNSQPMLRHATAFAKRLDRDSGGDPAMAVDRAFRLAYGRAPAPDEAADALAFLRDQRGRVDPTLAGGPEAAFLHGRIPPRDGRAAVVAPRGPQDGFQVPHDSKLGTGDFTIEAVFVLRSVDSGAGVRTIAAKWDGDPSHPGWSLGVTGKASRRKPQTLVLQLVGARRDGTAGEAAIFSDQTVHLDRPYLVAASVTLAGEGPGRVTFTLRDLSNDEEPTLVDAVEHPVTGGFGNELPLTLGARSGPKPSPFDGLLDDVRLSSGALAGEQLLLAGDNHRPEVLGFWRFEAEPGPFRDASGRGLDIEPADRAGEALEPGLAALADFCHALLNSSEFLYVD